MTKTFRPWEVDQAWLLPPSLHEFVPPGHLVHFVRDTVREALDLSAILEGYSEPRGYPPTIRACWWHFCSMAIAGACIRRANWRGRVKSEWTSWR